MFKHGFLGFCTWDIPAFIILAAIVVIFILHHRSVKKREDELKKKLDESLPDNTDKQENTGAGI